MSENQQEQSEAKLLAWIEGELDADALVEIERHLDSHPQHRRLLEDLKSLRDRVRWLPKESAPADLVETFSGQLERAALLAPRDDRRVERPARNRWPQLRAAAAVGALAVGLGAIVFVALPHRNTSPFAARLATSRPTTEPADDTGPAGPEMRKRYRELAGSRDSEQRLPDSDEASGATSRRAELGDGIGGAAKGVAAGNQGTGSGGEPAAQIEGMQPTPATLPTVVRAGGNLAANEPVAAMDQTAREAYAYFCAPLAGPKEAEQADRSPIASPAPLTTDAVARPIDAGARPVASGARPADAGARPADALRAEPARRPPLVLVVMAPDAEQVRQRIGDYLALNHISARQIAPPPEAADRQSADAPAPGSPAAPNFPAAPAAPGVAAAGAAPGIPAPAPAVPATSPAYPAVARAQRPFAAAGAPAPGPSAPAAQTRPAAAIAQAGGHQIAVNATPGAASSDSALGQASGSIAPPPPASRGLLDDEPAAAGANPRAPEWAARADAVIARHMTERQANELVASLNRPAAAQYAAVYELDTGEADKSRRKAAAESAIAGKRPARGGQPGQESLARAFGAMPATHPTTPAIAPGAAPSAPARVTSSRPASSLWGPTQSGTVSPTTSALGTIGKTHEPSANARQPDNLASASPAADRSRQTPGAVGGEQAKAGFAQTRSATSPSELQKAVATTRPSEEPSTEQPTDVVIVVRPAPPATQTPATQPTTRAAFPPRAG